MFFYPIGQNIQTPDMLFKASSRCRLYILIKFISFKESRLFIYFMNKVDFF